MSIQTRVGRIGSLLLLLGLFGCSTLADLGIAVPYIGDPPLTAIEQLQEKPKGALVYLRGTVSNYAPFLAGGAYLLQDGSGKIWIRTNSNKKATLSITTFSIITLDTVSYVPFCHLC